MAFKAEKILGSLLLIAGIGIIGSTLFASYNIFRAERPVPALFSAEEFGKEKEPTGKREAPVSPEQEMQNLIRQGIKSQLGNIIPGKVIARLLNLIAWSIFAGIATFGGAQISRLGIRLMK